MVVPDTGIGRMSEEHMGTVIKDSDEWSFIEYMLQLTTRTSRVKLLQVWHVASPHVMNLFERRTAKRLVVYSFVDASLLDEENTIQDVARRGFKIGPRGMKFVLGNFSLQGIPLLRGDSAKATDPFTLTSPELKGSVEEQQRHDRSDFMEAAKSQLLSGERRVFEFFLCKVGVGHSVVMSDEKEASGERTTLPPEYDSAYLQNGDAAPTETLTVFFDDVDQNLTRGSSRNRKTEATRQLNKPITKATAGVLPRHTFRQEYVVYDSSQVVPNYLVLFEVNPMEPELFAVPLCDTCQEFPASVWCPADMAKLCDACDERLHSHNKLVSRHIRVPLNEMPKPSGRCKQHAGETYEAFCTMCHAPVCRLCRPNHIHADVTGGLAARDPEGACTLIPLSIAYSGILERGRQPHLILEKRRKELRGRLEALQSLIDGARCNCRSVEQRCYCILEETMNQLRSCTEDKMGIVLCQQFELQRQMDMIEWSLDIAAYEMRWSPSRVTFLTSHKWFCQICGWKAPSNFSRIQLYSTKNSTGCEEANIKALHPER
ncbi:Zinc finger and GTP binding domains, related [Eimeria tenella]|uniref:Zinc finger and GTP binding domains, related n=1 Tax=Eimeria tenella TaxID=5802 RepID=U6KT93_EIMTE|nr:Zinc finger and GTP binding domains, related [Eimeria tenella]CDJ41337.1 Zinc finger and GTP binding domains, related [Eimeria tenella]|eukprot:XP_013232087.1 Zinc finger and GTP binding domains, related [Eimeria tenella]